jgi:hypothetical protein
MQWNVQEVVKRIVNELQKNGYVTWFGARCMYSPRALALTKMFLSCSLPINVQQLLCSSDLVRDDIVGQTWKTLKEARYPLRGISRLISNKSQQSKFRKK